MLHKCVRLLASVGLAALLAMASASPALAQGYLGSNLRPFSVLAGSTVTCTGTSTVTGDLGVSPGSAVIGFPVPCTVVPGGTIHAADATAAAAQVDLTTAFTTLGPTLPCGLDLTGTDLGGLTLTPGVYCFSTSAQLTGPLTLNALGNPSAVWVFRIGSTLTTASGSSVVFSGGIGNACAVQWRVGTSATLGTTTSFVGNILAQASITLNNGASLVGRALARTGAVTLDANNVAAFTACGAGSGAGSVPPPFPPPGVPTLPEIGEWALLVVLLVSGVYLVSRRTRATSGH
jgi:hypothetical protein